MKFGVYMFFASIMLVQFYQELFNLDSFLHNEMPWSEAPMVLWFILMGFFGFINLLLAIKYAIKDIKESK